MPLLEDLLPLVFADEDTGSAGRRRSPVIVDPERLVIRRTVELRLAVLARARSQTLVGARVEHRLVPTRAESRVLRLEMTRNVRLSMRGEIRSVSRTLTPEAQALHSDDETLMIALILRGDP